MGLWLWVPGLPRCARRPGRRYRIVASQTAQIGRREKTDMATWTVGAVRITRVEEQLGFASFASEQYFAPFERELLERHMGWLAPDHYSPEQHRLITSVHSWLI